MKNSVAIRVLSLFFAVTLLNVPVKAYDNNLYADTSFDLADFAALAGNWLASDCKYPGWCGGSDYDMSGAIEMRDLEYFTTNWLTSSTDISRSEITWVSVTDAGFTGYVSKYETTNAQFCKYLNEAMASGDITISDGVVYGAAGTNGGQDYAGETYFVTSPKSSSSQITYSAEAGFRVATRVGLSMADYPVTVVSWYGASAFCNYYGYFLPTETQWKAVADFDGSYTYGCGNILDTTTANCSDANPMGFELLPLLSPVGHYPAYGYGVCDMAGNASEWTSSNFSIYRIIKGGNWSDTSRCAVDYLSGTLPMMTMNQLGFRACRSF